MNAPQTPFTLRSILAGTILSALLVVMDHWSLNVVHASFLANDHMSAGAIFLFFASVLLINPVIRLFRPDRVLRPGELLVIYIMLLVTASVSSMGLGAQLVPILAALTYYATPANRWEELILPHVRSWLAPHDIAVTRPFFEGLAPGEAIPWAAWVTPLAAWLLFLMALYFTTICAISIMRREWVEKERLSFPLVQLPLAMVENPGGRAIPPLFRKPLFWFGFAVPFLFSTLYALNSHFPELDIAPQLNRTIQVFRGTTPMHFRLSFPILGFSYLINSEIAFSLWFFNLAYLLLRGWFNITGISSTENIGIYGGGGDPIVSALGTGAFIALFAFSIYLARSHLRDVFRKATGRDPSIDDSGEVMSYRASFWGFILGFLFLLGWLRAAGMSLWVAALFLVMAFVFWLMLTRIISESGLATLISPSIGSSQVVSMAGSQAIGEQSLVNLGLSYVYHSDIRTFPASSTMQAERIVEKKDAPSVRPLFWVMMGALLLGVVLSSVIVLWLGYTRGGGNLRAWFFVSGPQHPYLYVADYLRNPSGPNPLSWLNRGLGALIMTALLFLRNRFLWWPLHPIGMSIGMVAWVGQLWLSIFLAWLIKSLLLRYGGPKVYEGGKPLFFGLVLGQYSAAVIWFLVDLVTGHTVNMVFSI